MTKSDKKFRGGDAPSAKLPPNDPAGDPRTIQHDAFEDDDRFYGVPEKPKR